MRTSPRQGAQKPEAGRARPFFSGVDAPQARMRVSTPGDRFEREADQVSDAVVHGNGPFARGGAIAARVTPTTQRQEEDEAQATPMEEEAQKAPMEEEAQRTPIEDEAELQAREDEEAQARTETQEGQAQVEEAEEGQAQVEEAEVQARAEEESQARAEEEEAIQPKAEEEDVQAQAEAEDEMVQARGRPSGGAMERVEQQIRAARGLGNPLPEDVRRKMEGHFGTELSGVRIHTDALAVQLSKALNAQAFATGRDIFFNENRFAPGSRAGDHLLAHELTHTIQQGAVDKTSEVQLQPGDDPDIMHVRPEALEAIRLARAEAGLVNTKLTDADGNRIGWQHLLKFFRTAFGGDTIHPDVIRRITMVNKNGEKEDALPHWCGIFTWWALKTAGVPLPDWKIGMNILDTVVPRPPGSLPMKGDIAYRDKNQHFALVSGLESSAEAAGKPVGDVQVRTINGNTAGSDNLGGQVQEIWGPVSEWKVFFDPMGKLAMPDVKLVATRRDAEDESTAPVAETRAEKEAVEGQGQDTDTLETPALPKPEDGAGSDAQVALDIPPPAPMPPPEPVATVEKVGFEGSSDQAMGAFAKAAPSSMAASAGDLAAALDGKAAAEQTQAAAEVPELKAQTGGDLDVAITPPDQIPVPGAKMGDGVTGAEPDALKVEPHQDNSPAPELGETRKLMEKQPEGGFLAWLRGAIGNLMSGIRTSDPGVSTSAGARQSVALEGEADTGRMERQAEDGATQLRGQRDSQVQAFKTHPGQSNIKPRKVDEAKKPAMATESATRPEAIPPSKDADDYLGAQIPKAVRDKADETLATRMEARKSEAATRIGEAATKRDTDSATEKADAVEKARKLNEAADTDQKKIVVEKRGEVAKTQGEGVAGAYAKVQEFSDDAARKQTDQKKGIAEHVKTEEGKARDKLDEGEKDAEKKKAEKEKEAAEKKKELEKEQKSDSWWDRAANLVKKAVSKLTEAIDGIFTALREAVAKIIEKAKQAAVGLINKARDWVVSKLNDFRDWAKSQVDKYLKDSFPGLAAAINSGIDTMVDTAIAGVNVVADGLIAGVTALADGLAKVLDKILSVYQTALKAAVGIAGAIITGDFAEALKIAVQAACDIAGIDSKPIFDFFDRAGQMITDILKNVPKFFGNLISGVGMGIRNFGANILDHLKKGLISWLTGALSEAGITLPTTWDLMGIFSLVAQILGLTYENIKARIIKKFPAAEKVFGAVEKGFELIAKLRNLDFSGLWEEAKAALSNLYEMVIGGIRNWVITTVIKEGITWLLSLMNPASAIVKVLKVLFDLVMWLIERFNQIKEFVLAVYDSIAKIAAGVLEPAAKAVENALSRALPVVISMVASIIGLGGISKAISDLLKKITAPINKVIDAIIDKVVAFAKTLLGKGKAAARKVGEKIKAFLWPKKAFSVEGESHTLEFTKAGVPVIRSTPQTLESFIAAWEAKAGSNIPKHKKTYLATAKKVLGEMTPLSKEVDTLENANKEVPKDKLQKLLALQTRMSEALKGLLGRKTDLAKGRERYKLEGLTGTYGTIPKPTGDYLTGDHQPQAAVIKYLAAQPYFQSEPGNEIHTRASGSHASGGYVINLEGKRHAAGRTYGSKGAGTKAAFVSKVGPLASDTTLEDGEKRGKAVEVLKSDLGADVTKMRAVYDKTPSDPIWRDLDPFTSGDRDVKETLVDEIRKQVKRGLSILGGQPMNSMKG